MFSFPDFEKHTKGNGTKLFLHMDYIGSKLYKNWQGIFALFEPQIRLMRPGLGYFETTLLDVSDIIYFITNKL